MSKYHKTEDELRGISQENVRTKKTKKSDLMEEKTPGWTEYHIAFFNVMDFEKFKELPMLKAFVECFLNDALNIQAIKDNKTRKMIIDFLVECDRCASEGERDMQKVAMGHAAQNRAARREKTVEERAKAAGLITLKPQIPSGKKLIV